MEHHSLLNSFWTFSISADSECSKCLSKKSKKKKKKVDGNTYKAIYSIYIWILQKDTFSYPRLTYTFFLHCPIPRPESQQQQINSPPLWRLRGWSAQTEQFRDKSVTHLTPLTLAQNCDLLSSNTTQCGCRKKKRGGGCGLEKSDILFKLS